jgi:ribosomal protein S4E
MNEQPKFDYGETVQITRKEHNGRIGAVVAINGSESDRTYTVEFGDGSEGEFGEEALSRVNERNGPVSSS